MPDLYQHTAETWDAKKCTRLAKRKQTDGYGAIDHLPGFLKDTYGAMMYNGGCIREGKLYDGEFFPFPIVAEGFEVVFEPMWFYRIKNLDTVK